jgi:hypothetical protein
MGKVYRLECESGQYGERKATPVPPVVPVEPADGVPSHVLVASAGAFTEVAPPVLVTYRKPHPHGPKH